VSVPELTREGVRHARAVADASATLRTHASRLESRALRARLGSSEREKCLQQARHLRACAKFVESEHGKQLDTRLLQRGWRVLQDAATQLARKIKAEDDRRRAEEADGKLLAGALAGVPSSRGNPLVAALKGVKR
jgi:hypothetical protein